MYVLAYATCFEIFLRRWARIPPIWPCTCCIHRLCKAERFAEGEGQDTDAGFWNSANEFDSPAEF